MKFNKTIFLICLILTAANCSNYKVLNENLVEKLNAQMKVGNFDQLYDESSESAKRHISKTEFVGRMKDIAAKIREIDESLYFQRDKDFLCDKDICRDDNFAYRKVENNGKKLGINIVIDNDIGKLKLLDFCVFSEDSINRFNYCATNASKL